MWIGHNSVTALECTLLGISYAEEFYQIPKDRIFGGFDWAAFEAWIEKTYNPRRLSVRSFGLARTPLTLYWAGRAAEAIQRGLQAV